MRRIIEDISRTQNKELVKGQMRVELGRFARNFAAAKQKRDPPPKEQRAASQPAVKAAKTRTFDELVAEETQLAPGQQDAKKRLVKQRVGSAASATRPRIVA